MEADRTENDDEQLQRMRRSVVGLMIAGVVIVGLLLLFYWLVASGLLQFGPEDLSRIQLENPVGAASFAQVTNSHPCPSRNRVHHCADRNGPEDVAAIFDARLFTDELAQPGLPAFFLAEIEVDDHFPTEV